MQLDNSMISTFCQCNWKYALRYERHLTASDARPATQVGTLVHEWFDAYLSGADTQEIVVSAMNALREMPVASDYHSPQNCIARYLAAINALAQSYTLATASNGLRMVWCAGAPRWIIRYGERDTGFNVSLNASLPNGASHDTFMGRMDHIVEDGNQQLWLLELKTSASAGDELWQNKWRLATQPRGYAYAAQLLMSKPIAGVIIIPVKTLKNSATLQRELPLRFTPEQLEQWRSATLQMYDVIRTSPLLPTGMYNGTCSSIDFGKCEYFDYCRSNYTEDILEQTTVVRQWSPLSLAAETKPEEL